VGRTKCNGPVNFFPGEEVFSSHTCFSLLGNPPPPPPKAPLSQRRGHLRLQGSDRGVLSIEGWPIRYDRVDLAYMKGQSRERMRSGHRRQEMAGSGSSPSHLRSLVIPDRGLETNRGVGGGIWLGSTRGSSTRPISTRETAAAYTDLLDVT
jgi:hypothetical protein